MNRPQSELDQIRAAHPEKWAQLAAASFKPQRAAEIILTQVADQAARDAENPPEKRAALRVKSAQDIVTVHLNRAKLAHDELDKVLAEVRDQFPDLQIELIELPFTTDTSEDFARNAERIAKLESQCSVLSAQCTEKDTAFTNLSLERDSLIEISRTHREDITRLEADLKTAQDALKAKPKK